MYAWLIFLHSLFRWFVLISLLYATFRAYKGYTSHSTFSTIDNAVRHWTATIAHIQLLIGCMVYLKSPLVKYFFGHFKQAVAQRDAVFFGIIHITLMLVAIVVITIGSALAKRRTTAAAQFKTQLIWFAIALLLILIAIPWPFSPFAARPYIRTL
jgi:uncharacterized Tic20 family protein